MNIKRHIFNIFVPLFVVFFAVPAVAAGYQCSIAYTGCKAGYYLTQTSVSTACYTTSVAGNRCAPCSVFGAGYTCAGGTACPVSALCTAGITKIRTGGGLSFPLYATRQTAKTIDIGYASKTCYVSLATGEVAGSININSGGTIYHTIP